jgi:glutamate synthase domain-containing protein 1
MTVLVNLNHRGACGCEPNTGDGAGINLQMPDKFLRRVAADCGCAICRPGRVWRRHGLPAQRTLNCAPHLRGEVRADRGRGRADGAGLAHVPTDNSVAGRHRNCRRTVCAPGLHRPQRRRLYGSDALAFERKLYVIRKRAERRSATTAPSRQSFYIASLSSRTLSTRACCWLTRWTPITRTCSTRTWRRRLQSCIRAFSTNTFPSWERAHPYRYLIHNGEINTIRGNVNWMYARQSVLKSELFGADLEKFKQQIVDPDGSDSAQFDNALEFLHLAGRPLHHVAMMMIPEPWSNHESMAPETARSMNTTPR